MCRGLNFDVNVQWVHVGQGNKTITHTLRFVVDLEERDLGSLIEAIKFNQVYRRVQFYPFVNQKTLEHSLVQRLFQEHNYYQKSARKIDVNGVPSNSTLIRLKDGRTMPIDDLLLLPEVNRNNLFS